MSEAYADQQHRLWRLLSGVERPYDPEIDEKEIALSNVDAVRLPGYYVRRDPHAVEAASDHVIASGMILKHSGLRPGDHALEYGAGFGQTALALARLGVRVDTVDISSTFCQYVQQQADFFQVPLRAFTGRFGENPRPGQKYQLIWFYESFHHCLDFLRVVYKLGDHLADEGRIILGGEPVFEREYVAVPYPWGVRLHSEVVAVMRKHHWFELGFSEDFLVQIFTNAGFVGRRIECDPSRFGLLHIFEKRPDEIHFGQYWVPAAVADGWHDAEPDGRWTKAAARIVLDTTASFTTIELDIANLRRRRQSVEIVYGTTRKMLTLSAGEKNTVSFIADERAPELKLNCTPSRPAFLDQARTGDRRALGVFVRRLRYRVAPV